MTLWKHKYTSPLYATLDLSATQVLYLVKSVSCLTFCLVKSSPLDLQNFIQRRRRFIYASTIGDGEHFNILKI